MTELKKIALKTEFKRYFFMILGCFSYSLSLQMFLIPNKIVGGGVSGAASLINIMTGLPAGLFIVLINLPILFFGFKLMGWKFILRCFITTATLGLTTELLGRITNHVIPFGSIATHVALFDALVVIVGAIALTNLENILYALILIFVSAKVSDLLVLGLNKAKLCYIITTKAEEISEFLISHSPRGVTLINGEGMYSKQPKGVLLTCVKNGQIASLKLSIKQLDENAFVIVTDANEVYGKGFKHI